jgi:hypothetical protein
MARGPMPKPDGRLPLAPLVATDGEKHAEFKRRRDEFEYMKVLPGGEAPYLADGWHLSKKLKWPAPGLDDTRLS